ncbi:hypothetical protein [Kiloniella sp. b19]|uniref:hypothetical protein n=1 Tax=Kiloniella sp. GXU_MW_B19 TaxID=3141326 RepID=UPI0031D1A3D3
MKRIHSFVFALIAFTPLMLLPQAGHAGQYNHNNAYENVVEDVIVYTAKRIYRESRHQDPHYGDRDYSRKTHHSYKKPYYKKHHSHGRKLSKKQRHKLKKLRHEHSYNVHLLQKGLEHDLHKLRIRYGIGDHGYKSRHHSKKKHKYYRKYEKRADHRISAYYKDLHREKRYFEKKRRHILNKRY